LSNYELCAILVNGPQKAQRMGEMRPGREGSSMMKRHLFVAAVVAVRFVSIADIEARAADLKLLGAVGVRQIMLDLGPRFERATGHRLVNTFDSTGLIVRRIAGGEDFDLVMINRTGIDSLAKSGKVVVSSTTDVARSVAAAAVRRGMPKPDISTVESFKSALLAAKSIARPSPAVGGSSGDHIVKVLERLGIADQINAKSMITEHPEDMSAAPGYRVADGRAELALHPKNSWPFPASTSLALFLVISRARSCFQLL
jgi:molybdate transport system substrate-binding protein